MRTYKESVRSPRHVEACIANSYILDEAILYCIEYIPNSRRGSYKQGKPLFMDDDADDEQPRDKKGKNITFENLKFKQVRKWVLSCFDGVEEWEEKHKNYLNEQLRASRGRGARSNVKPMAFIPWLRQQLEKDKMSTLKRLVDGPSFKTVSYKGYRVNGMQQIDVMRSYIAQVNIAARDAQVKETYRQIQRFQKMDGKDAFQKMDGKVIYPEVDIREAQRYLKKMKLAQQTASNSDSKITVLPYSRESSIHKMPSSFPPNQDALSDTHGYCQNRPSLHQPAGSYPSSQQGSCKYGEGAKQKADDAYTSAKDTMSGKAETNYEAPKVPIVWYFGMSILS
ncbi:hypothetical protein GIB67_041552 [Kingdonia uniflora]|uniref:Uncharacterized protein n=1 Tax=Kingdonia uniflora TaxID=39325 RepID=A0A7J7MQD2_9MAGN|nr:hypothetical protein GIB67_041552 [Kingdonia uniflora]